MKICGRVQPEASGRVKIRERKELNMIIKLRKDHERRGEVNKREREEKGAREETKSQENMWLTWKVYIEKKSWRRKEKCLGWEGLGWEAGVRRAEPQVLSVSGSHCARWYANRHLC